MRLRIAIPESHVSAPVLDAALEAVTRLDEQLIRSGESPQSTDAIKLGARWRPEPPGTGESFDHGAMIAARGHGDCDDWAPLHAATLRVTGADPGARAVVQRTGPSRWHAVVQRSNGKIDDPSEWAGMSSVSGHGCVGAPPAVCAPMFRPAYSTPQVAARELRNGWQGRADLPWVGGTGHALSCVVGARDPCSAVMGAMRGVCIAGSVAAVADPVALAKLLAIEALMRGEHPAAVELALRTKFPELARVTGHITAHSAQRAEEIVGMCLGGPADFDPADTSIGDVFGDVMSAALPIAGGAAFGPLGAAAGTAAASALRSQGGGGAGLGIPLADNPFTNPAGFSRAVAQAAQAAQAPQAQVGPSFGPAGAPPGMVVPAGGQPIVIVRF